MDADLLLARALQAEEDEHLIAQQYASGAADSHGSNSKPMSIVDPEWEMIDPNPDVRALFIDFDKKFFWGRLQQCEVRWSPRMTSCAGLCCYEGRGGLCSIRLSEPLLKLRPRGDLVDTLLHEMIHAYLFVTANNKDHDAHGPEFHKHMNRLNAQEGTKISVYHTFHDEVNLYKTHHWRCDGPCRERGPYYGWCKRSMNRAPAPRDLWWPEHQRTCGGNFIKVKEPEGYGQKKSKAKQPKSPEKPKGVPDIRSMFGGKNVVNVPKGGKESPVPTEKKVVQGGVIHRPASSDGTGSTSSKSVTVKDKPVTPNLSYSKSSITEKENRSESPIVIDDGSSSTPSKIVGGILSRDAKKTAEDEEVERTLKGPRITTIFHTSPDRKSTKPGFNSTTGSNIHTISSSQHESNESSEKVRQFAGSGYKVGASSCGGTGSGASGKIVRRIPGIGIIESARPTAGTMGATKPTQDVPKNTTSYVDKPTKKSPDISESGYLSDTVDALSRDSDGSGADSPSILDPVSDRHVYLDDETSSDTKSTSGGSRPASRNNNRVTAFSSSSQELITPPLEENPDLRVLDSGRGASPMDDDIQPGASIPKPKPTSRKRDLPMMPYFSSDEEDDNDGILFKLKKPKLDIRADASSRKGKVAHGVTFYYPSVGSRKSIKHKKKRIFGPMQKDRQGKSVRGRNVPNHFSADRNRRGLSLDDGKSEEEEFYKLGATTAAGKKKIARPSNKTASSPKARTSSTPDGFSGFSSDKSESPQVTSATRTKPARSTPSGFTSDSSRSPQIMSSTRTKSTSPAASCITPPKCIQGIDFDMSQFSGHKRRQSSEVKKPIPILPKPPPSFNLSSLKRSIDADSAESPAKRFRVNVGSETQTDGTKVFTSLSNNTSRNADPWPHDPVMVCPACQRKFRQSSLNAHIMVCGKNEGQNTRVPSPSIPVFKPMKTGDKNAAIPSQRTQNNNATLLTSQQVFAGDPMVDCPSCQKKYRYSCLNRHLNVCINSSPPPAAKNTDPQQADSDPIVECPSCVGKFRNSQINEHLDSCLPDL